jgi:uncharacterized iron-regulated protein
MNKLITLLLVFSSSAISAQDINGLYKVYDTRNNKEVSLDEIVKEFNTADVLFFGEEHDDSIGHILEAQIFEKAHKAFGSGLALSMEMFERDVQLVVNEYLAGLISEKNLIKEGRAWKNYSDYKPLVEYAKTNQLKVIAANTPARYTNAVTKNGLEILYKFSTDARRWLPLLPVDTATGRYYERFLEIMGGHGEMPGMHIYQSQNLWDATMAWSIHTTLKNNANLKILHLNGRFHTDERMGIIAQLKKYSKEKLKTINITCTYSEDMDKPEYEAYKKLADFVIVTKKMNGEK